MSKVGFVVNPRGGRGKSLAAWRQIESQFRDSKAYFTTEAGGGTKQAHLALSDGCHVVAAVGGDGTVSEVGEALIDTDVALSVIPVGTGNDYARTLNIPADPLLAAQIAFEGKTTRVDVGKAEGQRHFLNIAGAGFDAEVMTRFNNPAVMVKKMPVKVRYYMSILQTFSRYKGVRAELVIDGHETHVSNLLLLAVGCAQFYGAGMHILPMADLTDGLFDVAWGHDVRLSDLNKLMALIYKGQHIDHPNVKFSKCKSISIQAVPATPFHIDGDVTGMTPVTFECVPQCLSVVVPYSENAK